MAHLSRRIKRNIRERETGARSNHEFKKSIRRRLRGLTRFTDLFPKPYSDEEK